MKLPDSLLQGRLIKRYKRFLADIKLNSGEVITAHCANPGSMLGLKEPGSVVWISKSNNPKRKLAYSWELVECGDALVGINTSYPNKIVEEGIRSGAIEPLDNYETVRREVKYGKNSRIDILLESRNRPPAYVEVKNVHLMRKPGLAEFPDAVTSRGAKHLNELKCVVESGERAVMVYLIQFPTAEKFKLAEDIDPVYTESFKSAVESGVEALAYVCDISLTEICIRERIPIENPNL